ncbi:O-antigen ligase family protein [Clostridium estertheticum]|uniref:O-antigen ligase family protein n=1 Tax=Clostridium estertheticum TaxID=238834 RepID=UPI001C0DBF6B|nr:O-antigen ligase family protein [Clostridium estertheticum]MBU3200977.1 O-antigen ligase family protein [Clostridium estertheticum]WAG63399.1 O-antigen ligase family protein [Clostridium estertheticum]
MKVYLIIISIIFSIIIFIQSINFLDKEKNYRTISIIMISITNVLIFLIPVYGILHLTNKIQYLILIYSAFILINKILRPINIKNIKFLFPIIILLICCFISVFFAFNKNEAINLFFKLLGYIGYIIIIMHLYKDYNSKLLIIKSVKLSSVFIIITGAYQLILNTSNIGLYSYYNPNTNDVRISMIFNDSLEAAVFTSIIITFIICELLNNKRSKILKLYDYLLIIILFGLLIETGSRTTLISIVIAFFIFFILINLIKNHKIKFYMKVVLISPLILLGSNYAIQKLWQLDIFKRFLYVEKSIGVRSKFWNGAFKMFRDNIWGVGLGNFKYHALMYIPSSMAVFVFNNIKVVTTHAENTYLTILAEIGIVGFLTYLYIIIRSIIKAIKNLFKNKKTQNNNIFPILIIISLNVILINNMTTYFNDSQAIMSLFWIIIGLSSDTICTEKVSSSSSRAPTKGLTSEPAITK